MVMREGWCTVVGWCTEGDGAWSGMVNRVLVVHRGMLHGGGGALGDDEQEGFLFPWKNQVVTGFQDHGPAGTQELATTSTACCSPVPYLANQPDMEL